MQNTLREMVWCKKQRRLENYCSVSHSCASLQKQSADYASVIKTTACRLICIPWCYVCLKLGTLRCGNPSRKCGLLQEMNIL